jgi:steroid delta-isomerase-like uncharacterized protein
MNANRRSVLLGSSVGVLAVMLQSCATTPAPQTGGTNIAQQITDAWNASNWDKLATLIAPDIVYIETGTGRKLQGIEPYMPMNKGWKGAFPDLKGSIQHLVVDRDLTAAEFRWVGTHPQPLTMPNGQIVPATNKKIDVPATVWIVTRDGKASEIRHHLDVLGMMGQLGLLPG